MRGDLVLVIDADLQDPPELLAPMYEMMVRGKRRRRLWPAAQPRRRNPLQEEIGREAFYRLLARITRVHIPVDTGDFRLMSRRISDQLVRGCRSMTASSAGWWRWLGYKQVAYEYDRNPRYAGSTKYPLAKMIGFALDALISFSMVPLRIATYVGAL